MQGFLTAVYVCLFYAATAFLIVGVAYRIWQYASAPAPLKVPTMPAPLSKGGVAMRIFYEVVLFRSLFRSNKWIWLFGWMFHLALLLVLVRHLRYFTEPVWFLVTLAQPFGKYGGLAMVVGLMALLGRRIVVQRITYISSPSDYLMLILLLIIGLTGCAMTFVVHTDIIQLKAFMLGVICFDWQQIPLDAILLTHLGAVIILMIIFPISKLLHAPGIFFSPSRNQVDNAREQRHLAPWAAELEKSN